MRLGVSTAKDTAVGTPGPFTGSAVGPGVSQLAFRTTSSGNGGPARAQKLPRHFLWNFARRGTRVLIRLHSGQIVDGHHGERAYADDQRGLVNEEVRTVIGRGLGWVPAGRHDAEVEEQARHLVQKE